MPTCTDTPTAGSTPSPLFSRFFAPLEDAIASASGGRSCPVLDDRSWLIAGVLRALEPVASGRDFLQRLFPILPDEEASVGRGHYFEALKSGRRGLHVKQTAEVLAAAMADPAHDPLRSMPGLENFEVFAGDGHWHEHAARDPRKPRSAGDGPDELSHFAVGHLYGLNLRTAALTHLSHSDEVARRKEHDMRALKRLAMDILRQGTPKGRKVIWVWDKAGIDFRQWYRWKQSGSIYFLSRVKENMKLEEDAADKLWDRADPINAGVERDALCGTSAGVMVRWVRYRDPISGTVYDFVTNEMSLPPGVIAQLYRMRWDIEKVFDDVKNKQFEQKAWASSSIAKTMQAHLICLSHNLMRLCERWLEGEQGIVNEAEIRRRAKREAKLEKDLATRGETLPKPWQLAKRCTQISVKLIRWLRVYLWRETSLEPALAALRRAYASP